MPLPLPSQIGRYRILGVAGRWARGWVYRGRDDSCHRDVRVKLLSPDWASDAAALQRFRIEAIATSILNHPFIITIFEFGEHNGEPFMAFEALEGQNLVDAMNAGMSLKVGLPIMLQVLDGLAFMHKKRVIHHDIRPANIFVCSTGQAKITNFWLARLATPFDMSPEHVRYEAFDGRTDLFSVGCVLYKMVTGRKPFGGKAWAVFQSKIINEEPEMGTIPQGPQWDRLRRVIASALQKKPEDRYPDARTMHADLELALKELGKSADWTPPPSRGPDPQAH